MRSVDSRFYKTRQWESCRAEYLKKVNHLCERCLADGKLVPAKFVHHKIWLNEANIHDPSITLNFENLEALCQDCHNSEHFGEKKENRWRFEDGKLVTNG